MTDVEPQDNSSAVNYHSASVADARTSLDNFALPILRPFWSHLLTASGTEPRAAFGAGSVSIQTTDGVRYQLQTSLTLATWTDEGNPVTGDGLTLTVPVSFTEPRQFWRWLVLW